MEQNNKIALVTGALGQDGSYLTELLLSKNYIVHGIIKSNSMNKNNRLSHLIKNNDIFEKKLFLHEGNVLDFYFIDKIIYENKPDEVYNLAADSHIQANSLSNEIITSGTFNILENIKVNQEKLNKQIKFCQASSSEIFGSTNEMPQDENTRCYPNSLYSCAKLYAHNLTVNYRNLKNLHASSAILFNHESPRRSESFVTRKITKAVAKIYLGLQDKLYLGDIDTRRDWGFAGDYMNAMWLMTQQKHGDDYVIGTGVLTSVRDFCKKAFLKLNMNYEDYIVLDDKLKRRTQKYQLVANNEKAKKYLNWKPKIDVDELITMMVNSDYEQTKIEHFECI